MKYFAMIGGERVGPCSLEELHTAGVRPDTYVWCKGMADWQKAEDVAEICRFYRLRIFNLMHPSSTPQTDTHDNSSTSGRNGGEDPYGGFPMRFRHYARQAGADPEITKREEDISRPPATMIAASLILTLLCFPVSGMVALYYAIMSRKAWEEADRGERKKSKELYSDTERENFARMAHDNARQAKMWCGITFFLGFIFYAVMFHNFL